MTLKFVIILELEEQWGLGDMEHGVRRLASWSVNVEIREHREAQEAQEIVLLLLNIAGQLISASYEHLTQHSLIVVSFKVVVGKREGKRQLTRPKLEGSIFSQRTSKK